MNRDIYQTITDRFVEQLRMGTVPWQKPWFGVQNMVSRKQYRGINALLLGSTEFQSPFWVSFKQALDLGGHIKKGQKSTPVIYYKLFDRHDEAGNAIIRGDGRAARVPFIRWANVFNLDQTEGITPPAITTGQSAGQPLERAADIVENAKLCPIHHTGFAALYSPQDDVIRMPTPSSFRSPEDYHLTLFHEMTHNAETRIMPHGLGGRPVALASAMRRFGIIMNAQKPLSKMNKTENLNSCVEPYVGSFAESFAAFNYKETTIKTYKVLARRLGRLMDSSGISPSTLTPDFADQLARTEVRGKDTAIRFHHFARRFAEHLIDIGVVQPVPLTKAQIARATLLADFQTYLIKQRGLRPRTVETVSHSAERFLVHHFGNRTIDLKSLRAADTIGFVQHLLTNKPSHRHVAPASHLRSFFQYLFGRGETACNLALSLPKSAKCWDARLPRHLPPDGVEAVLASVRGNSRHGGRDYAMLLLMARLGLRAVEVIAIQLDDIDWRSGELLVRGKGKLHDRVPITSEVGEALSRYLRDERGETSCRTAFVTHRAPHRPFKDSQIVNDILKDALATTGQKLVAPYVGSHLLRHSLATLLVNTGASIDEVGNVLRHRSRASTMKYVRLDIAGLRSISQAWPMSGGAQ